MIANYIKIAIRNIFQNKTYSLINIIGLSVGITCFILTFLWINDELSFDKFHENSKNIYRLLRSPSNSDEKSSQHPNLLLPEIKSALPEIENCSRLVIYNSVIIRVKNETYIGNNFVFTDPEFFNLFDFEVIAGNPIEALKEPLAILITESAAKKYFQNKNVVGETLKYDNEFIFTIKGIIRDFPANSHIQGDFVGSYESIKTLNDFSFQNWYVTMSYNYLILPKDVDISAIENKIKQKVNEIKPEYFNDYDYILEPLEKIHLYSVDTKWDKAIKGNIQFVILFAVIVVLIVLIVGFNYTNMTIASFTTQFKNIGIKKTIGAKPGQIATESYVFTILICFCAFWISFIAVEGLLPAFNNYTGKTLIFNLFSDIDLIYTLISLFIILVVFSGSYPAIFLSRLKPISSIKGIANNKYNPFGKKSLHTRISRIILSFQFAVSIMLISFSIVITKQLVLLIDESLGFDKDQLIIIDNPWDKRNKERFNLLKDESKNIAAILGVSSTRNSPGESINNYSVIYSDPEKDEKINCGRVHVDIEYLDLIQANFIAGRNFSKNFILDSNAVIINQSMLTALGLYNPIGETVYALFLDNKPLKIIGVIEDIQTVSLKHATIPVVYYLLDMNKPDILVKLGKDDVEKGIQYLESKWSEIEQEWPFQFQFVDDRINSSYKTELKAKNTIRFLSLIALFLSCLGILGLVGLFVFKRTKEIAIRKINGCSVWSIVVLLCKEYMINIIVTSVITIPIVIYISKKWLQNYAFQIELKWWFFVLAVIIITAITFLTISFYVIKAARKNPVESLRYE